MYLTLGKNNKVIGWIKKELLENGNQSVGDLFNKLNYLTEEFDIKESTFVQYVSYVKTQLLDKSITYTEKIK